MTDLYAILSTQQANPHYLKRYVKFIEACNGSTSGAIERHHICPKSMFPDYKDLIDNKWNCARLSPRQHFIAHWLLAKAYGGSMWYGLQMMTVGNWMHKREGVKMTSSLYEVVRKEVSEHHSKLLSGRKNPKHSPESIKRMSEVKMGEKNPNYGKTTSQEQKLKISQANKGRKRTPEFCQHMKEVQARQPILTCPHCGLETKSATNMKRWHFDKCKKKGA